MGVIPLRCLLSQSGGYHRPLYYCRSWTCGGWGGVCRGAPDSAPHSVSCPSGLPVTGPAHTGCRWMSLIQYTDTKRGKKDFYSNQTNRLKINVSKCMFSNLYEHVDLSHGVLKVFESLSPPEFYSSCFQRGNLHQLTHPGCHLDNAENIKAATMKINTVC